MPIHSTEARGGGQLLQKWRHPQSVFVFFRATTPGVSRAIRVASTCTGAFALTQLAFLGHPAPPSTEPKEASTDQQSNIHLTMNATPQDKENPSVQRHPLISGTWTPMLNPPLLAKNHSNGRFFNGPETRRDGTALTEDVNNIGEPGPRHQPVPNHRVLSNVDMARDIPDKCHMP